MNLKKFIDTAINSGYLHVTIATEHVKIYRPFDQYVFEYDTDYTFGTFIVSITLDQRPTKNNIHISLSNGTDLIFKPTDIIDIHVYEKSLVLFSGEN